MDRGSGLAVGSTQRSIPGLTAGLPPLALTWCNQTSKGIDADLGPIWGPGIWRLSHTEEMLEEDHEGEEKGGGGGGSGGSVHKKKNKKKERRPQVE